MADERRDETVVVLPERRSDPERGTLLTRDEYARLVELLALLNDLSVTQLDTDEADDLNRLLYKITHDGEERPSR